MSTNKRLLTLMSERCLTSKQVADLVHVSLSTVQKWRQTPGNISHYEMPRGLLELLEIKLCEFDVLEFKIGESNGIFKRAS